MTSEYYNRDGEPITEDQYLFLAAVDEYRRVGSDTVGDHWVSTVWLGINHAFRDDEEPVIFETMVFPSDESSWMEEYGERFTTEGEAKVVHDEIVAALRGGEDIEEVRRFSRHQRGDSGGEPS